MSDPANQVLVIIPAYQAAASVADVVRRVLAVTPEVLVVDDGSTDGTGDAARRAGARVLRQEPNQGKGAALSRGFDFATQQGYRAVITLDADGQHDPAEIPIFLEVFRRDSAKVVVGNRMEHAAGMPWVRRATNHIMSWMLSRRAGQHIPDTQNGYRLYDVSVLPLMRASSSGFAAESEVLLRLASAGIRVHSAPTSVIYGEERSAIHPFRDTIRFFRMLRLYGKEST